MPYKTFEERQAYWKARYAAKVGRPVKEMIQGRTDCRHCGVLLTEENWRPREREYTTNANGRTYPTYVCATCARARTNAKNHSRGAEYNNAATKKSQAKLKAEIFAAYGNRCACCGNDTVEFLTIDHVNNDGAAHRRGRARSGYVYREAKAEGFPKDRFQLLCMNCNAAKGWYGECPHARDRDLVRGIPFALSEVA